MKRILLALALLLPGAAPAAELIQHLPQEFCLAARSAASPDQQMLEWTHCLSEEKLSTHDRALAYTARAVLYEKEQDFKNALKDFNAATAADPTLAIAFAGRGALHLAMDNPQDAVTDLTEALKLDPTLLQAYLARGTALVELKRPDEAIADFTFVIDTGPKLKLSALQLRALAYASKSDWQGTITDCTAALKLSNAVGIYEIRAAAYANSRQYDKAVTDFSTVITRQPTNALAYNNRAIAYGGLKKYELAIADLSTAIKLSPNQAEFYESRGTEYDEIGNCQSAVADFDHALTMGESGIAYNGKAWVRATCPDAAQRNGTEALALAIKAIQLGAGDADLDAAMATPFHMTLAAAYAENGQFDDAVREQQLAIKLLTDDARRDLKDETKLALAAFKAKKPFRWPAGTLVTSLTQSVVASGFVGSDSVLTPHLARNAASPIARMTVKMPPLPPPNLIYDAP